MTIAARMAGVGRMDKLREGTACVTLHSIANHAEIPSSAFSNSRTAG